MDQIDWTTIAHFEGLNIERQAAIADLQEAEQRFLEFLMTHVDQPKP